MAGETVTDAAKLDAIIKNLNDAAEERKTDRARLDAACAKMDAAEEERKTDRAKLDTACNKLDAAEEEKKKQDAARADAVKADAEEEEKKKADAAKADAARKDADEEERKKADAARLDSAGGDVSKLRAEIAVLRGLMPAQVTPEVKLKMVGHQAKAERVALALGDSAGAAPFVSGESERDYAIRLMTPYLKYSKRWKDKSLEGINDSVLSEIETEVYHDAMTEAIRPTQFQRGALIPTKQTDASNRVITRYVGDPNACWDQFNPPVRHLRRILTPGAGRVQ